jgi:hypothetical protein
MEKLEEQIHSDLQQYLLSVNEVDERMPECPDVEGKWEAIANAYIPDGVREFQNYPLASLGWMMYIGMALAKMWDDDWQYYAAKDDLYVYLRDKRGYDAMDEYIRRDVLKLKDKDFAATEELVSECASRVHNTLMHQDIEPGTKEAFLAYVACLHQLYLFGAAIQLKRMGYHMTRI